MLSFRSIIESLAPIFTRTPIFRRRTPTLSLSRAGTASALGAHCATATACPPALASADNVLASALPSARLSLLTTVRTNPSFIAVPTIILDCSFLGPVAPVERPRRQVKGWLRLPGPKELNRVLRARQVAAKAMTRLRRAKSMRDEDEARAAQVVLRRERLREYLNSGRTGWKGVI